MAAASEGAAAVVVAVVPLRCHFVPSLGQMAAVGAFFYFLLLLLWSLHKLLVDRSSPQSLLS
jgi:hypothetical protein